MCLSILYIYSVKRSVIWFKDEFVYKCKFNRELKGQNVWAWAAVFECCAKIEAKNTLT